VFQNDVEHPRLTNFHVFFCFTRMEVGVHDGFWSAVQILFSLPTGFSNCVQSPC
jgi:hypothetical protein